MKFNEILHYITGEQYEDALLEQLGPRGRPTKLSQLGDTLKIDDNYPSFQDQYASQAAKFFKEKPNYLLKFDGKDGLPVEPVVTIAKTIENLANEYAANNLTLYTDDFLDKKKSPLNAALKAAIEELSGQKIGNMTRLGHTARVVRNFLLTQTDIMKPSGPSSQPTKEPSDNQKSGDKTSKSALPKVKAAALEVVKSVKDVSDKFKEFLLPKLEASQGPELAQRTIDRFTKEVVTALRFNVVKGDVAREAEIVANIRREFRDEDIDLDANEVVQFLKEVGVLVPKSNKKKKDEEEEEEDTEKDPSEVKDLDPDFFASGSSGVDDVASLTGGFGPQDDSMHDY